MFMYTICMDYSNACAKCDGFVHIALNSPMCEDEQWASFPLYIVIITHAWTVKGVVKRGTQLNDYFFMCICH